MPVLAEEPCCPCHFHWYKLETMIYCISSIFFVHVDRMTLMIKCHSSRIKPLMMTLPIQVSCRGMATQLKDYESHYDRLEIHPECTKTEIRFSQTFAWRSIFSCGCHPSGSIQLQGSLASTFHAIPPRPQSRWWKSSKQIPWNQRVIHRSHQDLDLTVSMSNMI